MAAWYAFRGGRAIGPLSRDEIAAAVESSEPSERLGPDDLFCSVGADDWRPGRAIPDLADLFRPSASTPRRGDAGLSPASDLETGDLVTGDLVTGELESGDFLTGELESGELETGDLVTGDLVTGDLVPAPVHPSASGEPPTGPMAPLAAKGDAPAPYRGAAAPGQASLPGGRAHPGLRTTPAPPVPLPTSSGQPDGATGLGPSTTHGSRAHAGGPRPPHDGALRTPTQVPQRSMAWVGVGVLVASMLGAAALLRFAPDGSEGEPPRRPVAAPAGALPPPYDRVHLGMRRELVEDEFPPRGSLAACHLSLIGDTSQEQPRSPDGPYSACPTVAAVAGATDAERRRIQEAARRMTSDDEGGPRAADVEAALVRTLAQLRGAARAGVLSDRQLTATFRHSGATLREAAFQVAVDLTRGALELAKDRARRRDLAALLDSACEDVEPTRVAAWIRGELALAQEGRRGLRRCPTLARSQGILAGRAAATGGALLLAAWVRSSGVDPDAARGGAVRWLRSEANLDEEQASFALQLASTAEATEAFFDSAVVLTPAEPSPIWGAAFVWFSEGEATRLMLGVRDDDALDGLESFLAPTFGRPHTVSPTTVTWRGDGFVAHLDRGAAVALTLVAR